MASTLTEMPKAINEMRGFLVHNRENYVDLSNIRGDSQLEKKVLWEIRNIEANLYEIEGKSVMELKNK